MHRHVQKQSKLSGVKWCVRFGAAVKPEDKKPLLSPRSDCFSREPCRPPSCEVISPFFCFCSRRPYAPWGGREITRFSQCLSIPIFALFRSRKNCFDSTSLTRRGHTYWFILGPFAWWGVLILFCHCPIYVYASRFAPALVCSWKFFSTLERSEWATSFG